MSTRKIWNGTQWVEIGSPALANVTPITQVGYDLLGSPDPATIYMIIDNTGGNNASQSFRINQRLVLKIMVGGNLLWQPVVWATGGTVSDIDVSGVMWRVHTFTSSGSFEVLQPSLDIEYLIVAGGGRGGDGGASWGWSGGYGGGGGVLSGSSSLPSSVYPISIGNGGTTPGSNGGNTTFNGLVAVGGGAGGSNGPGASGGSGGDGGAGTSAGGLGTPGQGHNGGAANIGPGGGGGAGTVGGNGTNNWNAGTIGAGLISTISGTPIEYSKGGSGTGLVSNGCGGNLGGWSGGSAMSGKPGNPGVAIVRYQIG